MQKFDIWKTNNLNICLMVEEQENSDKDKINNVCICVIIKFCVERYGIKTIWILIILHLLYK